MAVSTDNDADQQMPAQGETCFFHRLARGDVVRITTGSRLVAGRIAFAFEPLDEIASVTLTSVLRGNVHVDVGIRWVVVAKKTARRHCLAMNFQHPFPIKTFPLV